MKWNYLHSTQNQILLHSTTKNSPEHSTPAQNIYFWLKARGITRVYKDEEDTVNEFGKTDLERDISFRRSTPDLINTQLIELYKNYLHEYISV